jgi:hypothetical protein
VKTKDDENSKGLDWPEGRQAMWKQVLFSQAELSNATYLKQGRQHGQTTCKFEALNCFTPALRITAQGQLEYENSTGDLTMHVHP